MISIVDQPLVYFKRLYVSRVHEKRPKRKYFTYASFSENYAFFKQLCAYEKKRTIATPKYACSICYKKINLGGFYYILL